MRKTTKAVIASVLVMGSLGLTACGDSDNTEAADTTMAAASTTDAVTVTGQWARTSPMATDMGAVYMKIEVAEDDDLIGAMVDTSVAAMAQVHETITKEDGTMGMQEVKSVAVKAGTTTELKAGGYHIMLMKLVKPLETGSTISITLKFTKAGEVVVDVPVLEESPE